MLRVLRNTDVTLKKAWLVNGTPTPGKTINVTVKDLDGNDVATPGVASDIGSGFYTFDIDSTEIPDVALLDTTWTETDGTVTERVEVVGDWLFTEPQAREFDNGAMSAEADYDDDDILAERDRITDLLEQWTGRSWIPRYRRLVFKGTGGRQLWVPDAVHEIGGSNGAGVHTDLQQVLAVTVNGNTVSPANVVVDKFDAVLHRTDAAWPKPTLSNPLNVVVDVEYGVSEVIDGADWAALALVRDRLVPSNIPDRARSWTDEFGNINLDTMPTIARDWITSHQYFRGVA